MDREVNIDSIRALEEQIKEHERAIIKLKRARNSLLNVSKLPPEVLGNVFQWNITLKGNFDGLEEGSHDPLLVCHHWFEVASRTPELWTFWGNNLEDWEKRYLRSSPGASLDLVLNELPDMFGSVSESQQAALKDRAARDTIRRVHLQSDTSSLLTSIISPLLSPHGGLQTNSLKSLILYNEDSSPLDISFLAHSHLPGLRHLKLVGCTVSSLEHLTTQSTLLTTLQLISDISPPPTMPQLLSMLASAPCLQNLTLSSHAMPNGNEDGDGSCSVLPLLHLEELRLDGDPRQVFGLLRQLELPPEMGMLTLNVSHCVAADVSQSIGPYLRDHLRRRGRSRNGLGISLSSDSFITFNVGDAARLRPSNVFSSHMNSFTSIIIGVDQALPGDAMDRLTLDLISYTPREEIVYFRACGSIEVAKDLRVQTPNLKALNLYKVPLSLVFPMPDPDGSHVHERFPPSLQYLHLERPHLGAYSWIPLIIFLSHRSSSGSQLDSLLIDGPCHVCFRVAQRIRDVVGNFTVDDGCTESWCPFSTDCRWLL